MTKHKSMNEWIKKLINVDGWQGIKRFQTTLVLRRISTTTLYQLSDAK